MSGGLGLHFSRYFALISVAFFAWDDNFFLEEKKNKLTLLNYGLLRANADMHEST